LQASQPVRTSALERYGFNNIEELSEEIEARRICCTAQALPLVVKSIQDMCKK
jgi:hypothetical protein